jgi:NAD(P)-dependent dehydrogenase (short-subunit alcohol dehydrogenase family)
MDLQLGGKRTLITGGSRGIGKAIARALVEEGCAVAIAARDLGTTQATAAELAASGGVDVVPLQVDTGSTASVKSMVDATVAALGGLDILVNNAAKPGGQAPPPKLADIADEVFWDDVNVKVMGYLRCAREAAPHLTANGWGRIINISGLAARATGSAVGSMRNVSVAALTKNLADELGPHGVNVTVVHPGLTRTEATPSVVAALATARGASEAEIEERMAGSNSIRRFIAAEEIAWVVTFLASPRSGAINGDAIACGGGQPGAIHY